MSSRALLDGTATPPVAMLSKSALARYRDFGEKCREELERRWLETLPIVELDEFGRMVVRRGKAGVKR